MANRSVTLVFVVVLFGATASLGAGTAGAQSANGIGSCTTIDSAGTYTLTEDLSADSNSCIHITASHVTLDGNGHTIDGGSSGVGVEVSGSDTLSDITVKDVTTHGFTRGILFRGVENGTIAHTTATGATEGITLLETNHTTVRDNTVKKNALGIELRAASRNTITENTANDNKYGLHIEYRSLHNRFTDNTAVGNSLWDFYSDRYAPETDSDTRVTNLDMGSVTVDLSGTNVGVRALGVPNSAPSGQQPVGTAVRTTDYGDSGELSLSIHYADDNASDIDESSLALWASTDNGDSWSKLDSSSVNTGSNTVSADDVPHPATIEIFGSSGTSNSSTPVATETPTATPTATQTKTATTTATSTPTTTATPTATETTATSTAVETATGAPNSTQAATRTPAPTAMNGTNTTNVAGTSTVRPTHTTTATAETTGSTTGTNESGAGTNTTETTSDSGPGFGSVAALFALFVAAAFAVRRRH